MSYLSPQSLLKTSWTIHRLSPLHHRKEFRTLVDNPDALKTYSKRLRNLLTGDVLRGVQVGLSGSDASSDVLSKAGALKECLWGLIPTWSHWNEDQSVLEDPDQEQLLVSAGDCLGILVTLEYEHVTYKAALLAGPDGYHENREGSTYLPVLLTRLPNPLRNTFVSFLSANFDAFCSVIRLPSNFLCAALETYIMAFTPVDGSDQSSNNTTRELLEEVLGGMQLTLAFSPPIAPALKALDVHLPKESLAAFVIDGSTIRQTDMLHRPSMPFLESLSSYFNKHLAMKLDLNDSPGRCGTGSQHVRLSKIACSAFVLSGEGRTKIIADAGRVAPVDNSVLAETEDPEDRKNRLILKANESILRALIHRVIGRDMSEIHEKDT